MSDILHYFEHLPTWQKGAWVLLCLSASWRLEEARPQVRFRYDKWRHARLNGAFLLSTVAINTAFTLASVGIFEWAAVRRVGLLYRIELPVWLELVIALLLLDLLAQYVVHVLLHKVPFLWRLHLVHHSDEHVDATTGTRHHPGDYVIRELFALAAILIVGAPLAFYILYRLATVFFTYVTHANVSLPPWIDRALGVVVITPHLHKFHHHFELPWTDTNYGNMFSLWDRCFGTLARGEPERLRYGLDVLAGERHDTLLYQLALPFNGSVSSRRRRVDA